MKLSEVGEKHLTSYITRRFGIPFDDCALLKQNGFLLLVTTDMVTHATHFPPLATPYQMGWYSIAVNISDIAAKGGKPLAYVAAMGFPRDFETTAYEDVLDGMDACMKQFGGELVGGDTKETKDLTIAITAFGRVKPNELMLREGSNPGDAICVTGQLGKGGAALLEHDLESLLMITPRIREGRTLAQSGCVTSCMDISDGLAVSLYQLMTSSRHGFQINRASLPIHHFAKRRDDALELALYYGGDFELLFTIPTDCYQNLKKKVKIIKIGEVTEEPLIMLKDGEKTTIIENRGYEHFRNPS